MSSISGVSSSSLAGSLLSSGSIKVNGLASGLDTDKILEGLLAVQIKRIENIQGRQARIEQRQAAYKGIEARLLALQGQIGQLSRPQNGVFDTRSVATSDDSLVTAAASSSALAGNYQVRVNSLATAHQIVSQGFDSATSVITQGTFQLRMGTGAVASITIDSGNNTVQGLANAINAAGIGVTATLINDGSGGQAYRLLLSATKTGASNAIAITNGLAADSGGAVKPVFDSAFIGAANVGVFYSGTALPTSNQGTGAFTGTANNTYTFTVVTGGTVGTDNGLQVAYTDTTGTNTGTITLNAGDADAFKAVAQGIQVKFAAGTLVAGEKFTITGSLPQVQAAADASVSIGSGGGALTVTSATNQVDGLFNGLTLNLQAADPAKTVTLTVKNDTDKMRQSITDFVNSYNDLLKFIDEQVRYDSTTNQAGILLGDSQPNAVQETVRSAMMRPVAGLTSTLNRLGAIGITVNEKGRLVINATKLDSALAGNLPGATFGDVRRLFALSGASSKPGFEFVTASGKTKAASYQVTVTQAAEQAVMTATNPLAASTVLTTANNSFTITLDGATSSTITLLPGTYTRQALAQEVQGAINANASLGGRKVSVALAGGALAITSITYGANSRVTIGAGSALASLGFAGTENDQGVDVAGQFLVNNQVETAIGAGQVLIGAAANANTADLQVRVTLTPAQVGAGQTSDLAVTRGIASAVDTALNALLDPATGRMKTINDTFTADLDNVKKEIVRQTRIMESRRDSLLRQFIAMERTVSQLQSIGGFLSSQLSQINTAAASGARR